MQIIYYTDPGHGWFKINRSLLFKLGIIGDISSFSYQRNDSVYLEEDGDASMLFKALDCAGITWTYKQFHTNKTSKIRSYRRFNKVACIA
jgi:hypothetical protein